MSQQSCLEKFLQAQKQEMEKFKWCRGVEIGADPGDGVLLEWVEKYSKKFRKDFVLADMKMALQELKEIRHHMTAVMDACEDKIIESIELIE